MGRTGCMVAVLALVFPYASSLAVAQTHVQGAPAAPEMSPPGAPSGATVRPPDADAPRLARFSQRAPVRVQRVLVPAGSTVRDVAKRLEAKGLARAKDVLRLNRDHAFLGQQRVKAPSLEGYLYPGTYHIAGGTATQEILARMVSRLGEEVPESVWKEAKAKGLTRHEVLTLASIIQREAGNPGEMPLISAVFWNRMNRGMPLQADPTLLYALGKRQRLTRGDLRVDSPFNTYRYSGLPPGPIANPGKAAILAAVRPTESHYLYFAKRGRHNVFASTPRQHRSAPASHHITEARWVPGGTGRIQDLPVAPGRTTMPPAREPVRQAAEPVPFMTNPGS